MNHQMRHGRPMGPSQQAARPVPGGMSRPITGGGQGVTVHPQRGPGMLL